MLDLILFILFIFSLFIGLNRGFILQIFHLIGFIAAFIIATLYYDKLASEIELWIPYQELTNRELWPEFLQALPLETAFYSVISFAIIFILVKIVLQIIASMLDFVASIPFLKSINKLLGAGLGFIEVYLITFIILYVFALTPIEQIQNFINNSFIALFMLENTPYFSNKILELIDTYISNTISHRY